MMADLARLFVRDLGKVSTQLRQYPAEALIWAVPEGVTNSGGTLALHLIGNLRAFIGADLGVAPYLRDVAAEFSVRDVPRSELLASLAQTEALVGRVLANLDAARLSEPFPSPPGTFPHGMPTLPFLFHLHGHLNWHLGQLDYHRRLVSAQPG